MPLDSAPSSDLARLLDELVRAEAAVEQALNARDPLVQKVLEALSGAYEPGPAHDRLARETGADAAEKVVDVMHGWAAAVEREIADTPAQTLQDLILKARAADLVESEDIPASIVRDLLAIAAERR